MNVALSGILTGVLAETVGHLVFQAVAQSLMVHVFSGGLTLIIEAAMMVWRKKALTNDGRKTLGEAVSQALPIILLMERKKIQKAVAESFDIMNSAAGSVINRDISQIEATLKSLEGNHTHESAQSELQMQRHQDLREAFFAEAQILRSYIVQKMNQRR
jgi:hypothetical protein